MPSLQQKPAGTLQSGTESQSTDAPVAPDEPAAPSAPELPPEALFDGVFVLSLLHAPSTAARAMHMTAERPRNPMPTQYLRRVGRALAFARRRHHTAPPIARTEKQLPGALSRWPSA